MIWVYEQTLAVLFVCNDAGWALAYSTFLLCILLLQIIELRKFRQNGSFIQTDRFRLNCDLWPEAARPCVNPASDYWMFSKLCTQAAFHMYVLLLNTSYRGNTQLCN